MKTRKHFALALALILVFLAACGGQENAAVDTGNRLSNDGVPSASGGAETAEEPMADGNYVMKSTVAEAEDYSFLYGSVADEDWNTEEYSYIEENGYMAVSADPLSTFAADVDTASYTNLRRMLRNGFDVTPDAVRLEEMINYFHYDYPEPQADEPFSVTTEIAPCPWNEDTMLLRVGLQAAQPDWDAMPPSNLVFLIDVSGSMNSPDKLPLVKQAFLLLTENLRPGDVVSIVTYASSDRVVLDGATGDEGAVIQAAIEELEAGGSTDGSRGIHTAYALAQEHFIPGGNNRVILATDGDLNVGVTSEGELTRLIEEKKESGVFLSVMGFGYGNLKDNKLEALADHGNGNYAYIDTVLEAKRVLVEEMGGTLFTVAKDVKLQLEFNPAVLKGYRLVGYENRVMDAADFADDTKDGGEIGAGHRVTVLYELVTVDSALEIPEADLRYQTAQDTGSDEWLTVSIRYKEPDGDASALLEYPVGDGSVVDAPGEDTIFAACVAQFGMLLRDSRYAGTATYDSIIDQLSALPSVAEDSYKAELLELVKLCAGEE